MRNNVRLKNRILLQAKYRQIDTTTSRYKHLENIFCQNKISLKNSNKNYAIASDFGKTIFTILQTFVFSFDDE